MLTFKIKVYLSKHISTTRDTLGYQRGIKACGSQICHSKISLKALDIEPLYISPEVQKEILNFRQRIDLSSEVFIV